MSTATTTTEQRVVEIPLDQLHESPFNPRRTFLDLEDLAASIKAEGRIHQPLKVRPRAEGGYEIVFGHRRFRAAPMGGLITVPCIVEPMNDAMARSAQIAENLQRKDVHPIEEAEGFAAMMKDDGLSADELAVLVGKSRSHVYGRLKLLQACAPIRDACLAGEIGSEVALLIARLRTDKLQQKALGYIRGKYIDMKDGGKKSFRQIQWLLKDRFTLNLSRAIFDPEAALLVPEAGACSTCPKLTGNAPEFQDLAAGDDDEEMRHHGFRAKGEPDLCTDPDCFAAKKKAHLLQEATRLRADGKTVVDGGKAMAAITADGKVKGAYVALADVRKALKSIKGDKPATVLIQDPRGGKVIEAVKREDLVAAGVADKVEPAKKASRGGYDPEASRREHAERERQVEADTAANKRLLATVRAAAASRPRTADELRTVLGYLMLEMDNASEDTPALLEAQGVKALDELLQRLPTMTRDELGLLLLDVVIVRGVQCNWWNRGTPEALADLAKLYGIDIDAARAEPVQTPEPTLEPAAAESASTPPTAARARGKAAGGAAAKKKPAAKAAAAAGKKAKKVKDDAGSAGEVDRDPRVADMFEESHA